MSEMMKQWQLPSFGLQHLGLAEVPVPVPGPNEVLVRVGAVSLNYRDKLVMEGGMLAQVPSLPFVPVSDMAGEVVAVGPGVTRFKTGDQVIGNYWTQWIDGPPPEEIASLGGPLPGMLAAYVALSENVLVRAPASLTAAEASTLPVAALTAWFALVETGQMKAGETVLVQGTGGVALFGLQIARALGARVIITSRGTEKLERAKALGATDAIDTSATPNWSDRVLELTKGRGVDHVLEIIGGDNIGQSIAALASCGQIAQIGFLAGPDLILPTLPMMLKRAIIRGIAVGHRRAFEDMNKAIDEHGIKPVIDKVYAFDDARAAFDHLERGPFGKVVITVS